MHSSPGPVGKRPDFKQSRSAGWGWPRLVPINEQQSRLSQASHSSVSPSLRDHSEEEEPPTTMIPAMISKLHIEEDAPPPPTPKAASSSPTAGESDAGTVQHQPYEHPHISLSSMAISVTEERRATDSASGSSPVEGVAETKDPGLEGGSVGDVAEKKDSGSEHGSVEDVAEMSASASEHEPIMDVDMAKQGDTEIPVGYENAITDVPFKEEKPATPPTTPISPVMDRISTPSSSVPYYATPKIMVHRPSQSSEGANSASRTIDGIMANERQSLPQEGDSQPPQATQDETLDNAPPMQPVSLTPIALQAPKDQKIQKRKLYLRKFRNAAARKTILKATLGRQLAIPTKQMLRLLANGENLTVSEALEPEAKFATMSVPQEVVGPVTGAVVLPQGAVSDH